MNDAELLKKIDTAAQAANKTEQTVADAHADRLAKCKALGTLLLEAKKRHPQVKDFEAFLSRAKHVKLSAAYDYMKLVGGRKTDEEIRRAERARREEQRARKQKSRNKLPRPEPEGLSVTSLQVTESPSALPNDVPETAGQTAARRMAENAALFNPEAKIVEPDRAGVTTGIAWLAGEVKRCTASIDDVSEWLRANRAKLVRNDLTHLFELAQTHATKTATLVEILRAMRKVKV
jgi:hypothetical protein